MDYLKLAIVAIIIMAGVSSCVNTTAKETQNESSSAETQVEVVYFHGKQRCLTCRAIERFAREAVDSGFGGNDAVSFKVVDITSFEGERIADAYEITGSALLIIKRSDGNISYEDMTAFAFQNARKNTSGFKKGIGEKVREYLKAGSIN